MYRIDIISYTHTVLHIIYIYLRFGTAGNLRRKKKEKEREKRLHMVAYKRARSDLASEIV